MPGIYGAARIVTRTDLLRCGDGADRPGYLLVFL